MYTCLAYIRWQRLTWRGAPGWGGRTCDKAAAPSGGQGHGGRAPWVGFRNINEAATSSECEESRGVTAARWTASRSSGSQSAARGWHALLRLPHALPPLGRAEPVVLPNEGLDARRGFRLRLLLSGWCWKATPSADSWSPGRQLLFPSAWHTRFRFECCYRCNRQH